jgi:hypothetical protein
MRLSLCGRPRRFNKRSWPRALAVSSVQIASPWRLACKTQRRKVIRPVFARTSATCIALSPREENTPGSNIGGGFAQTQQQILLSPSHGLPNQIGSQRILFDYREGHHSYVDRTQLYSANGNLNLALARRRKATSRLLRPLRTTMGQVVRPETSAKGRSTHGRANRSGTCGRVCG